jgi:hypothetical protein
MGTVAALRDGKHKNRRLGFDGVMGIRFLCHACDRKLNVKNFLAGKNGICPHCGASVKIPAESQIPSGKEQDGAANGSASASRQAEQDLGASIAIATTESDNHGSIPEGIAQFPATPAATPVAVAAPVNPLDEDPDAIWYVRPPSGGQFGPADGDVMRRWIEEKRVSASGLVWREGWPEWKKGSEVFPQLSGQPTPPTEVASTPAAPSVATNNAGNTAADQPKQPASIYAARAKKKKGLGIAAIAILGVLIAVLAVTLIVIVINKS